MNAFQCANNIVRMVENIESKATEKEFNELQILRTGETYSLHEALYKLTALNERVDKRISTEKYSISVSNRDGTDSSLCLNQDTTMKELVNKLEKTCDCDIMNVEIHYITRQ